MGRHRYGDIEATRAKAQLLPQHQHLAPHGKHPASLAALKAGREHPNTIAARRHPNVLAALEAGRRHPKTLAALAAGREARRRRIEAELLEGMERWEG